MLTREAALVRLRTCGRLSAMPRPENVITADQLAATPAREVKHVLDRQSRAAGPRCLAPSANHPVLP